MSQCSYTDVLPRARRDYGRLDIGTPNNQASKSVLDVMAGARSNILAQQFPTFTEMEMNK